MGVEGGQSRGQGSPGREEKSRYDSYARSKLPSPGHVAMIWACAELCLPYGFSSKISMADGGKIHSTT